MRRLRLRLHTILHPDHRLIGQYGTADACGTCSGFTDALITAGAVSHYVPPWWKVTAKPKKWPRPGHGRL